MTDLDQMDLFQKETQFTSLQEVILVNRCQPQVREKVKKMKDTSFQNIYDLLKNSVQFTPLEKMLADILDSVSTRYSRTWSIVTTSSGALVWKHRVSEHGTGDNEFGGAHKGMIPTPTVNDSKNNGPISQLQRTGMSLNVFTKLFPTPTANEDACGTPNGKMQKMLGNHPEVRNQGEGTLNPDWVEWLMGFPIGWTNLEELKEPQQSKKTESQD